MDRVRLNVTKSMAKVLLSQRMEFKSWKYHILASIYLKCLALVSLVHWELKSVVN